MAQYNMVYVLQVHSQLEHLEELTGANGETGNV